MNPFYETFIERMEAFHSDMEQCIGGVSQEGLDWIPGEGMNSMAVLVMHTVGATRYLIGDLAGQNPIGRNPETEFATSGLDESTLKRHLAETLEFIRTVLDDFSLEDLPAERFGSRSTVVSTVGWALLHTLDHTAAHTGHLQITRQLWDARQ